MAGAEEVVTWAGAEAEKMAQQPIADRTSTCLNRMKLSPCFADGLRISRLGGESQRPHRFLVELASPTGLSALESGAPPRTLEFIALWLPAEKQRAPSAGSPEAINSGGLGAGPHSFVRSSEEVKFACPQLAAGVSSCSLCGVCLSLAAEAVKAWPGRNRRPDSEH